MTEFKETQTLANDLMADDRFHLGGRMYQISSVVDHSDEMVCAYFHSVGGIDTLGSFIIEKTTTFTIYNQNYLKE